VGADDRDRDGVASPTADELVDRVGSIGQLGIEGPDASAAADALATVADEAARLLEAGSADDVP
jgi:hypothetical protein